LAIESARATSTPHQPAIAGFALVLHVNACQCRWMLEGKQRGNKGLRGKWLDLLIIRFCPSMGS
jgi:hypothetical protein